MIRQITEVEYNLSEQFSLKKLTGKRVLAKSGEIIGHVNDVIIKDYKIIGILVGRKLKDDMFIDRKFFDSFRENAVLLSINPVVCIEGLKVFDHNGRKIGTVTTIIRDSPKNEFDEFIVNQGPLKKDLTFKKDDIESISENMILKIEVSNSDN
ncbi:PRC-barrel domain-containing protein [Candidatus Woesearchaeota archaeon]|nr:PRC-barrel domain-containing protein [Candidatus Woesearchaeota archaeon]